MIIQINRNFVFNKKLIGSVLFYNTIIWQIIYFVILTDLPAPVWKNSPDLLGKKCDASQIIQIVINDKLKIVENLNSYTSQNRLFVPIIKFSYSFGLIGYINFTDIVNYNSNLPYEINFRGPPELLS